MPLIASLLHPFKIIEKNGAHTDQNMPQRRRDMGVERDFLDSQKPLQTVLGGRGGNCNRDPSKPSLSQGFLSLSVQ